MEIGVLGFFILLAIFTWFGECTKIGKKFFNWFGIVAFNIDLDAMED